MPIGFDRIVVDAAKLRDYCLSPTHIRGRHKARSFRAQLGLTAADTEVLRIALISAARDQPQNLRPVDRDRHGQRYVLDFEMATPTGSATVRSGWIIRTGTRELRFVTCYVR